MQPNLLKTCPAWSIPILNVNEEIGSYFRLQRTLEKVVFMRILSFYAQSIKFAVIIITKLGVMEFYSSKSISKQIQII